ncbi:MAG: hypothetical protein ABFD90_21325 [Phycisphaerales bacterium]
MRDTCRRISEVVASVVGLTILWITNVFASALPPDPNNAASLYHRAMMACPEPNETTADMLQNVLAGAEPDRSVRQYVEDCKQAMDLVASGAGVAVCDWSVIPSAQQWPDVELLLRARRLASAMGASVAFRTLAGDYQGALDRCLLIHRVAGHGGGRHLSPLAITFDSIAHGTTRYVLGRMPPDEDTLTWLKSELASTPVVLPSLMETVEADVEFILRSVQKNDRDLTQLRAEVLAHTEESAKQEIARMIDEQLLDLVRQSYTEFLDEARRIIDGNLPFADTYEQLAKLEKRIGEQAENNPAVALLSITAMQRMTDLYMVRVQHQAHTRALQVALELYLEAARTGRLPRRLPIDWQRDPLTGEDFDYEITKTGFILRSQDRDTPGDGWIMIEFGISDASMTKQPEPWDMGEPNAPAIASSPSHEAGSPSQSATGTKNKVRYRSANDLDAIVQDEDVPPKVRERAKAAITRLRTRADRGFGTPEPILIRASLCRTTCLGVTLSIIAIDQDADTAGLRIKEAILALDGQIGSLTEDYPAYIRGMPVFDLDALLPVTIRSSGQRKDHGAWEAFLIDSYDWLSRKRSGATLDQRRHGLSMPSVWISIPEPDKVRVFVCLYDRQRHESDYVEVENHLSEKPVDPSVYMQMFQSGLEEQSNQ